MNILSNMPKGLNLVKLRDLEMTLDYQGGAQSNSMSCTENHFFWLKREIGEKCSREMKEKGKLERFKA